MGAVKAEALEGLVAAATRETAAADALTEALRGVKEAMEALDPPRMEVAVTQARRGAEALSLAANSAASLTRLAARAVGLSEGASLAEIGECVGADEGAQLLAAVGGLRRNLDALAVEVSAQGIAARYGAGLWAHLVGLRGESGSYGSNGQLRPGTWTTVNRV